MSAPLRIGFDAKRYFANATGLGVYSRTLINTWSNVYPEDELTLYVPRKPQTQSSLRVVAPSWPLGSSLWRSLRPLELALEDGLDIFHGLSNEMPRRPSGLRKGRPPLVLVTIHDVLFRHFPKQYPATDRFVYDIKTRYACQHADHLVAISEATASALTESYEVSPDRLSVVPQAVDMTFASQLSTREKSEILARYGLPRDYVLCLGSLVHRKNQLRVVEAYSRLAEHEAPPLVVAGSLDSSYAKDVQGFAHKHLKTGRVYFLGSVPFEDLEALLQGALLSVYLSLGEGFGLPVTESLLAGTPVLTSDVSSMPEAGVGLAVLTDPFNTDAILESLRSCIQDAPRLRRRIEEEKDLLAAFTPQAHVKRMRELYLRLRQGAERR